MKNKSSGFTLIELLVVISIIALLSSIVLSSLNTARAKANDAKRIQEIREISKAVELYYLDNGHYPFFTAKINNCKGVYDNSIWAVSNSPDDDRRTNWDCLSDMLVKYFPSGLPKDPKDSMATGNTQPWFGGYHFGYTSASTGSLYQLIALLETPNHPLSCANNAYRYLPFWPGGNSGGRYAICKEAVAGSGASDSLQDSYYKWGDAASQLYAFPN